MLYLVKPPHADISVPVLAIFSQYPSEPTLAYIQQKVRIKIIVAAWPLNFWNYHVINWFVRVRGVWESHGSFTWAHVSYTNCTWQSQLENKSNKYFGGSVGATDRYLQIDRWNLCDWRLCRIDDDWIRGNGYSIGPTDALVWTPLKLEPWINIGQG